MCSFKPLPLVISVQSKNKNFSCTSPKGFYMVVPYFTITSPFLKSTNISKNMVKKYHLSRKRRFHHPLYPLDLGFAWDFPSKTIQLLGWLWNPNPDLPTGGGPGGRPALHRGWWHVHGQDGAQWGHVGQQHGGQAALRAAVLQVAWPQRRDGWFRWWVSWLRKPWKLVLYIYMYIYINVYPLWPLCIKHSEVAATLLSWGQPTCSWDWNSPKWWFSWVFFLMVIYIYLY